MGKVSNLFAISRFHYCNMNGAVWFQDLAYSGPIVKGRISCVNLQGHGFKGIFFKKEIISTMFTIELSFGHCSWISIRSFDQFKDFFQYIHEDRLLRRHISRITVDLSSFLITNENYYNSEFSNFAKIIHEISFEKN